MSNKRASPASDQPIVPRPLSDEVADKAKRVFELMESQNGTKAFGSVGDISISIERIHDPYANCKSFLEVTKMASSTITIELSEQDRRRIDALCKAMCPTGTVAVVVCVETVGFTDGVHLFSSVDDAERWMLQEIRQHGGEQSHLTLDEFQKRLKPSEDFWVVDVHDRRR